MKMRRAQLWCALILLASSGCKSKSLQELDASGGGFGLIDAGAGVADGGGGGAIDGGGSGATDGGGGATDAPGDGPSLGRRSFAVTAAVQVDDDAGSTLSHEFTLTLDLDRRLAITGTPGGGGAGSIQQEAPDRFRLLGPRTFWVSVPARCGGSVTYSDLVVVIGPTGALSGTGAGQLTTYDSDVGTSVAATMTLAGLPDIAPPVLNLSVGGELVNPWTPLSLVSSEPLPPGQTWPTLRSTGGDVIALGAPTGMDAFVVMLASPWRMLRFDETYRVAVDGITDFVGFRATGDALNFTTRAAPPLVAAAEGFESFGDATLGGARVLSGAGAPVISGARSLYIPPVASLGSSVTQVALRVPIAVWAMVLRFSYRTVNPADAFAIQYLVGSVGGTIGTGSLPGVVGESTTPATIDGALVSVGQVMTGTIALPTDARGEVVFVRVASQLGSCAGPPPPPVPGIIIDDLRTE